MRNFEDVFDQKTESLGCEGRKVSILEIEALRMKSSFTLPNGNESVESQRK